VTDKLQNLKKEEKARIKKIKTLETEIAKIKSDLEKPVETENMDDLNAELVRFTWHLGLTVPHRPIEAIERRAP
jgi:hypothetical protein